MSWKRFFLLGTLAALLLPSGARAAPERFSRTLGEAEAQCREHSGSLKAAEASRDAAREQAEAAGAPLYPRLSLEASYFYQTEVPSLTLPLPPPAPATTLSFGSHSNYSVGPTLTYTLFDAGASRGSWRSARAQAEAREEDLRSVDRQVLFTLRNSYSRVQLGLRQMALTSDSLKLAQAQYRDILLRFNAGAASRLDRSNAHREVLSYQLAFSEAQAGLGASLRDLLALLGEPTIRDVSRPFPAEAGPLPEGLEEPTLVVSLDSLEQSLNRLGELPLRAPGAGHPQIRSLALYSESAHEASEAQSSALWPRLQLQARSALIYPNGPVIDSAEQNTVAVSLSLPLFEAGFTRSLAGQRAAESLSWEFQKEQRNTDLQRDWQKGREQFQSLQGRRTVVHETVLEAGEIARLTYVSYREGKTNFLDVQAANLKQLQARVNEAQLESSILSQLALLAFLSDEKANGKE
jgi:outer membrane protein TolC